MTLDMTENNDILDILVDWFETIEEIELTDADKVMLAEIAEIFNSSRQNALEMGVLEEDFEDWFRFDVLENWSALVEEEDAVEQDANLVQTFFTYVKEGEQRLYFQMLKRCLTAAPQAAEV